jgi:hypothetical protein
MREASIREVRDPREQSRDRSMERAEPRPKKTKLSFLERITGTRNVKYQPKGVRVVQESQQGTDDDLRDLEIPAFLRKSKR